MRIRSGSGSFSSISIPSSILNNSRSLQVPAECRSIGDGDVSDNDKDDESDQVESESVSLSLRSGDVERKLGLGGIFGAGGGVFEGCVRVSSACFCG